MLDKPLDKVRELQNVWVQQGIFLKGVSDPVCDYESLSRRQADLVRAQPRQLTREHAIGAAKIRRKPAMGIVAARQRPSEASFKTPSHTASDVEFFPRSRTVSDIDFFPRDYAARTASDIDFFRALSTRQSSLRSMTSAG